MQGQVNKIFRKSNAENARGFLGSIKFFPDDDCGENSCNTAHHLMNLYGNCCLPVIYSEVPMSWLNYMLVLALPIHVQEGLLYFLCLFCIVCPISMSEYFWKYSLLLKANWNGAHDIKCGRTELRMFLRPLVQTRQ